MPSGHGGGGSGGGHSSGGGGGHFSGGGHFGGGIRSHHGHNVVIINSVPYRYSGISFGIMRILTFVRGIFLFPIMFFAIGIIIMANQSIGQIRADYDRYQDMIVQAEQLLESGNASHFVKAVVYSREYMS